MRKKEKKWSRKQEHEFFDNLNELLRNGYTLARSLDVLQMTCPKLTRDFERIQEQLCAGEAIDTCLRPFVRAHILDELALVNLHGCQLELLRSIGLREQQYQNQFKQLAAVLCYPVVLLILLSSIVIYLGLFLMPQIGQNLFTTVNGLCVGIVSIGLCIGGIKFKKSDKFQRYQMLIRIPIIGRIAKLNIQQALYLHLGYLLQSGVSLQTVVAYCRTHQQHWICQLIGQPVMEAWQAGHFLEQGLNQVRYLSPEAKTLFLRGNRTEQIGRDLIQLSKYLTLKQEQRVRIGIASVQPLFFIVIGIMVVCLYMALLLPLYDQMADMGEAL